MPLLQFIGILLLVGATGGTVLFSVLWWRSRRSSWAWGAFLTPVAYGILLVILTLGAGRRTLAPGTAQAFCGFYLDCHLSVAVTKVERGPSAWRVTLTLANSARRVTLAPHMLRVELLRPDSGAAILVPDQDESAPLEAGASRSFTVSFAAPANGEVPVLRVSEGYGVDRLIEGVLIGDDDALGRGRVRLGL